MADDLFSPNQRDRCSRGSGGEAGLLEFLPEQEFFSGIARRQVRQFVQVGSFLRYGSWVTRSRRRQLAVGKLGVFEELRISERLWLVHGGPFPYNPGGGRAGVRLPPLSCRFSAKKKEFQSVAAKRFRTFTLPVARLPPQNVALKDHHASPSRNPP